MTFKGLDGYRVGGGGGAGGGGRGGGKALRLQLSSIKELAAIKIAQAPGLPWSGPRFFFSFLKSKFGRRK